MRQSISMLGDALRELKKLPSGRFDLCIADPPYNMSKKKGLSWAFSKHVTMQEHWDQFSKEDYFKFSREWIGEVCRVVKPNGNLLIFGTFHNIYTLGFILHGFDRKILNSIIWLKPNAQPNITCRMLTESTEQIIWACNNDNKHASKWYFDYALSKKLNGDKQMRNGWTFPLTRRSERVASHPSQKPEALYERMVSLFSQEGDWILDPFAGVGTTAIVGLRLKRKVFLIEKLARYWDAQKTRLQAHGLEAELAFERALHSRPKSKVALSRRAEGREAENP